MATFKVDLRGATPINGHTGEDPITAIDLIEAECWIDARRFAARRYGIATFDPAMLVTENEHDPPPPVSGKRATKKQ